VIKHKQRGSSQTATAKARRPGEQQQQRLTLCRPTDTQCSLQADAAGYKHVILALR